MRVDHPWVAWNFDESLHQKESFNQIFNLAKESIPFLVELSKATGLRFLFETHSGALLASTLTVKMLFEETSPEHVGVIYDPANTLVEGNLRPRSETEILGKYLAYVHAKNVGFFFDRIDSEMQVKRAIWVSRTVPPDAGMLDWMEVFFALKNAGYRGFISVEEFFSAKNLAPVKAGIEFLKECELRAPGTPCAPCTKFNE